MEFLEAKKKHEDLVRLIEKYSHEYYVLDNPTVSDFEYDQKMEELQRLEEEFPELITKTSPTQRIIGQVLDGFEEIHHEKQMLSLGDVFNDDELLDWVKKTEESAHKELEFVAEMKIDGLAMSLVYQDGVLKYAATRGDGMTGEDVTTNVLTIPSIPTRINLMGRVEVRGEIYMPKKSFAELNEARKEKGEPLFANARNAAAGSIRNLDSSVARSRKLDGWWYYFANAEDFGIKTHAEAINKLQALSPKKYRNEIFDDFCNMLSLGVIDFPPDYDNKGFLMIPVEGNEIEDINEETGEKIKVKSREYEKYNLSFDEEIALIQLNLAKEELIAIRTTGKSGNISYVLPSDRPGCKLKDDRAYTVAMLAHHLVELRRSNITNKRINNIDWSKAPIFVNEINIDKF